MERAAIVIAVIVAIIFAAGGAGAFHLDGVNWMRFSGAPAPQVAAPPGSLPEAIYQASEVRVSDAAAVLRITPEDRSDIAISIENPGRAPMPGIRLSAGRLDIDGRLRGRVLNCREDGGVDLLGYGGVAVAELPVITLRVPRAVVLDLEGGALTTEIGPAQSVDIDISGCGDTRLGDVTGALEIDGSGSGDVTGGAAGSAEIDLAGSGSVRLGAVQGALSADIAGSGSVSAASANGLEADLAGSGELTVTTLSGQAEIDSAGAGSVSIAAGSVTRADFSLAGSGTVSAPQLAVQQADIDIAGSGDVSLGAVGDIDVRIMGSGGVRAASISGATRQRIMGSGEVTVGAP